MSSTDQIQELFDHAIASVPSGATPSSRALHQRLRQRSVRARLSTISVSLLVAAISATALFVGVASNSCLRRDALPQDQCVGQSSAACCRPERNDRAASRSGVH
jgi:hypothetical protein